MDEKNKSIPAFFTATGWNISTFYINVHDQGDIGIKGLIFIQGMKN